MKTEDWRDIDARKVFIEYGTPQWLAWDDYTRRTANHDGLPTTTDRNTGKRGWRCLGDWPPGYSGQKTGGKPPSAGTNQALKMALRREACDRIRCTALADPANKEGWLHGLIDFVTEKQRMPDAEEQAHMRARAEAIRLNLDMLPRIKPQPRVKGWSTLGGAGVTQSLGKLRAAMMGKAEREIFGEVTEPSRVAPIADTAYAEAMAAAPDREPLT